MIKKSLAGFALAGLLLVGVASASSADEYPVEGGFTATPPIIAPGGTSTLLAVGIPDGYDSAEFEIVDEPDGGDGVVDPEIVPLDEGTATSEFTATVLGVYTVQVTATVHQEGGEVLDDSLGGLPVSQPIASGESLAGLVFAGPAEFVYTATVTVAESAPTPVPSAPGTPGTLPATGGQLSPIALWVGIGAIGIGALIAASAVIRRRSAGNS